MAWGRPKKVEVVDKIEAPVAPVAAQVTNKKVEEQVEYKRFVLKPFFEEKGLIIEDESTGEQYDSMRMLEYLANKIDTIHDILKG